MNSKYNNFKYVDSIKDILSEIKLNNEDISYINEIKTNIGEKSYTPIIEDIYKLTKTYKFKTKELAEIYNTSVRNTQLWLKELGLNRTKKEASEIRSRINNLDDIKNENKLFKSTDSKYRNFKYKKSLQKALSDAILDKEDINFIENAIRNNPKRNYVYIIEDLYKFVKIIKIPNKELTKIYGIKQKTLSTWLYELGLCRKKRPVSKELKPPKKDDYLDFNYELEELEVLKNTVFTDEQSEKLKEIYLVWGSSKYNPIIEDLYKFWLNNYTPEEIGHIYGKSNRLFQNFFKKVGLNRDRFEAQAIAVQKRDYKQIMLKGRGTMTKNNISIKGSPQEQYARNILNCKLPLEFPKYEIIVGLNNRSILDDGKEIDIPIIVMNGDKMIKIAIEYNGTFWHNDTERDELKEMYSEEKGYKIFYIECNENSTDKQIKEEIDKFCDEKIIKYIKCEIKKGAV